MKKILFPIILALFIVSNSFTQDSANRRRDLPVGVKAIIHVDQNVKLRAWVDERDPTHVRVMLRKDIITDINRDKYIIVAPIINYLYIFSQVS